jgi:membrane protein
VAARAPSERRLDSIHLAPGPELLNRGFVGTRGAGAAQLSNGWGRHPVERLHSFFAERIWSVRPADLRSGKRLLYRLGRIAYCTVRGFFEHRLTVRAAALTYYSVLSVVPFLAFAFAVLKGLGAYGVFLDGTLRPYLRETFGGSPALLDAIERILHFVERTDLSRLGALGVLLLVYTSVSLLSSVEDALNEIWGAPGQRPFLRQLTNYVTLLVTTPLLVLTAATFATAAQSSRAMSFLRDTLALGPVIDVLLRFTSVVVVGIALFACYVILPNVRTRLSSALIGASVSAVLWQGALVLHVRFQVGVASYSALYSVLSAVPIFLVWTYVSWIVVLVGAQVAASHQNDRAVRQQFYAQRADQALREALAVVAAAYIARDFVSGDPGGARTALAELAELNEVPQSTIQEILDALVQAGLLARTADGRGTRYVPGRDLDTIRVKDLQDALRRDARAEHMRAGIERLVGPELRRVLHAAEEECRSSRQNLTLRELAAVVGNVPASPQQRGRPPQSRQEEAHDDDARPPHLPA